MVSSDSDAVLTDPGHPDSSVTVAMEHLPPSPGRPGERLPRTSPGVLRRAAGQALIKRINGWLITGAVASAGLLSFVAAHAFHGHTVSGGTHTSTAVPPSQPSSHTRGGLQAPAQPPAQSPAPAAATAAPVMSGGS